MSLNKIICFVCLWSLYLMSAASPDYFKQNTLHPASGKLSDSAHETIDTFTNALTLSQTDLSIPGPNGMAIDITRTFTGTRLLDGVTAHQSAGMGWNLNAYFIWRDDRGLYVVDADNHNQEITYRGKNMILQLPDGSLKYFFAIRASGNSLVTLKPTTLRSKDNWIMELPLGGNIIKVHNATSGIKYTLGFSYDGRRGINQGELLKQEDAQGNWLAYHYQSIAGQSYLHKIDSNDGREVIIKYDTSVNKHGVYYPYVKSISYLNQTWRYHYHTIEVSHSNGIYGNVLDSVESPLGHIWNYGYQDTQKGVVLTSFKNPIGGQTRYDYDFTRSFEYISAKYVKDKEGHDIGTWIYHHPKNQRMNCFGQINAWRCENTTVTTPTQKIIYTHANLDGDNGNVNGSVWTQGLLLKKQIYDKHQNKLEKEVQYHWGKANLPMREWFSYEHFDHNVYERAYQMRLIKKEMTVGNSHYIELYDKFDANGNPQSISQTHEQGTRVKKLAYRNIETSRFNRPISLWRIGLPKEESDDSGNQASYTYFDNGKLQSKTVNGATSSFTYHPTGDLATTTDPNGHVTRYEDYKMGQAQRIEYADGAVETRVVNDYGLVDSETDGRGNTTHYRYDELNRVKEIIPAQGVPIVYHYDEAVGHVGDYEKVQGRYKEVHRVNSLGQEIEQAIYDNGTLIKKQTYRYDAEGRRVFSSQWSDSETDNGTKTFYDALGRTTQIDVVAGNKTLTSLFDYPNGHETIATDPKGSQTKTIHQAYGEPTDKIISITQALNTKDEVQTNINRFSDGRIKNISQGGLTKTYSYDENNRVKTFTEPETGTKTYSYYPDGSIKTISQNNLGSIQYSYDKRNRIKAIDYPDNTASITKDYDKAGNLKYVYQGQIKWDYDYDASNQLKDARLRLDGKRFNLHYDYDELNHLKSLQYPDGTEVSFAPNALGQATQLGQYATSIHYHPNSLIRQFNYGNGLNYEQSLNTRQLPETLKVSNILSYQYDYDNNQNIFSIKDNLDSTKNITLDYDNLNRLNFAQGFGGKGEIYYDVNGNIKSKSVGEHDLSYDYDNSSNRLKSVTNNQNSQSFEYTDQGEITSDGKNSLNYNAVGQVTQANNITYEYDGNNHRTLIHKKDKDIIQIYDVNGLKLYEIEDNQKTKFIYLGRKLIAKEEHHKKITYYHNDLLGSPVAATDEQGQSKWTERYLPYGDEEMTHEDKASFTGKDKDSETGLNYFGARYYNPIIGRFLSPDAVQFTESNPVSFNRYTYANNNPYSYVDPDGNYAQLVIKILRPYIKKIIVRSAQILKNKTNPITQAVRFQRWKVGDSIDKPLPNGSTPSWKTVRSRYWKNRAGSSNSEFSKLNIRRMQQGKAPIEYNPRTGKMEPKELHHVIPQRAGGSNNPINIRELTPDQHGSVDPFRHTVPTTRGIR